MRSGGSWLLLGLLVCAAQPLAAQNTVAPGSTTDSAAARARTDTATARPPAVRQSDSARPLVDQAADSPRAQPGADAADAMNAPTQPRIRPIAVAKWTILAGAVAAAVYGYRENRLADSRFDELDRLCQAEPDRCQDRTASGTYQDADLEARYQEVKRLDHRAALGLVGAEVGVATTLALFLLDLHHAARNPPNIPYTPPKVQVVPGRQGGVEVRFRTPTRKRG